MGNTMKVYVIAESDYDGVNIESVYSTKEKAIEALPYYESMDEDDIYEFELDPVHKGEKYEIYHYCNVDPNTKEKVKVWGGTQSFKPSEVVPFEFCTSRSSHTQTIGWGKTAEEAESNARIAQSQLHPVWQVWVDDKYGDDRRMRLPHPSTIYKGTYCGSYAVHEDFNVAKIAVIEYMATGKLSPFLTVIDKPL